jgi:hypothetical protein
MDYAKEEDEIPEVSSIEDLNQKLKEHLGISIEDMQDALSKFVIAQNVELSEEFMNVAPFGDYSKLMENKFDIAKFFKEEAHKPEHWIVYGLGGVKDQCTKFVFNNDVVDDGTTLVGYVVVNSTGKIKHAFAQSEE